LSAYYEKKYYQENKSTYNGTYEDNELLYFNNKIEQKYYLLKDFIINKQNPKLLDIGCGEGFTLNYFQKLGWDITGLDYTDYGCKNHNPDVINSFIKGDIYENIKIMINSKSKYDMIWLDNILEHVLDHLVLLDYCYRLGNENSVL